MFSYFLLSLIPLGIGYYKLYNKLENIHISIFQLNKKLNYYLAYQYYLPNYIDYDINNINNIEKNNLFNLCSNSDVIISNSTNNYNSNCIECNNYSICEKCKLLDENKIYLIL